MFIILFHAFPFNSRPHKEVDASYFLFLTDNASFQFTTSQGGRPSLAAPLTEPYLFFQFTTSQGGRRTVQVTAKRKAVFQFTTSQGGRRATIPNFSTGNPFNSRPHKEVDGNFHPKILQNVIFQFTTSQGGRPRRNYFERKSISFNSRPHKEVDKFVDFNCNVTTIFQFTTSQGGRRGTAVHHVPQRNTFNSRPHKEVDLRS